MFDTQEWAGEVRAALFDHDQSAADEDWVRLLHLGMKVSLTTDEGRPTRIGLVVGDRMTGAEVTHLRPPHEASPGALTKIAHATPGGGLIWLGRRESEYQIEAIQPANSSRRGLPESPVIDVVGPGHLRVLFGDRPVWYARAGESSKISGQREGLQRVVRERFADFIGEHLLPLANEYGGGLSTNAELRVVLAIEELARGIQRRRHGGTLVFVRSDDRVWKSLCNIRYEIESLNGGAWPGSHVVQLLHNDGAILSGRYSEGWNQRKTEALRELNRVRLFEACDAVAALSGADGAVVLRTELEQVAFGVELKASSSGRDEDAAEVRYEDSSFTIHRSRDIAEYGTRHRSAFRFCKADPNAVCVVVSQDGAVKVVFNHDDTVMYLDNADEGFFGL